MATTTPLLGRKIRERIESIDESLRNVVTNFQNRINLKQLYKDQVKDINTLLKIVMTNLHEKINTAKKGDKRINDCFNSVKKEINSMNQTAFKESQQCRLYASIPISKQIESGLMVEKKIN